MTLMQKYFYKIKLINLLISGSLLATQPDTFINGGIVTQVFQLLINSFLNEGQFY